MKLTVNRNDLSAAVTFAHQGCGTRSPLYSGILLQAGQDGLRFTGSDGYVSFESLVPGEYDSGEILLPGLTALVVPACRGGGLPCHRRGTAVITAGRSRFDLQTLPADGYPVRLPTSRPAAGWMPRTSPEPCGGFSRQ